MAVIRKNSRFLLEKVHMSQIELSRRTRIDTSTISDWRKKKD